MSLMNLRISTVTSRFLEPFACCIHHLADNILCDRIQIVGWIHSV